MSMHFFALLSRLVIPRIPLCPSLYRSTEQISVYSYRLQALEWILSAESISERIEREKRVWAYDVRGHNRYPTKLVQSASCDLPNSVWAVHRCRLDKNLDRPEMENAFDLYEENWQDHHLQNKPLCIQHKEKRRVSFLVVQPPGTIAGTDHLISLRHRLPARNTKSEAHIRIYYSDDDKTSHTCNTEGTVLCPCRVRPHPATVAILPISFDDFGGKQTGRICCLNFTSRSNLTSAKSFLKSDGE